MDPFRPNLLTFQAPTRMCASCVMLLADEPHILFDCDHEMPCARCRADGDICRPVPYQFTALMARIQITAHLVNINMANGNFGGPLMLDLHRRVVRLADELKNYLEHQLTQLIGGMSPQGRELFYMMWQRMIERRLISEGTRELLNNTRALFSGWEDNDETL